MTTLSQFSPLPMPTLTAGAAITQGNLCYFNPVDGKAYPCNTTSGTVVTGPQTITAETLTIVPAYSYSSGSAQILAQDGLIYFVGGFGTSGDGAYLFKMTLDGQVQGSVYIDTGTYYPWTIIQVSNGNIICTGPNKNFKIVNPTTFTVSSVAGGSVQAMNLLALSGGGFAASYTSGATTMTIKIYDNAANVLYTCGAVTQASGCGSNTNLGQLANGNIVTAYFGSGWTVYYAIFSTVGATVKAATTTSYTPNGPAGQLLTVSTNGFAIAPLYDGATYWGIFSYDNTGTLVNSIWTQQPNQQNTYTTKQVVSDGTYYYMFLSSTDGYMYGYKVNSTTGAFVGQGTIAGFGKSSYCGTTSAYNYMWASGPDVNGNIVVGQVYGTLPAVYAIYNANSQTWTPPWGSTTAYQCYSIASLSLTSYYTNVINCGDGFFVGFGMLNYSSYTGIFSIKTNVTPILGVATSTVGAGSSVQIDCTTGQKTITALKGPPKSFNHTGIGGNSGEIMGTTVYLNGFGNKSTRSIN